MTKGLKLKGRKVSSVFLVLLILISAIYITPISVSAVGGVEEKLNIIKSVYPSDSYFTVSGGVCYSSQNSDCELANIPSRGGLPTGATVASVAGNAWSCCSFAKYVFYCTFGLAPNSCWSVSQSEVKIGDYIDFYSTSYGHHYGIYLGQDSTNWYIYDSNFTSPATNRIRYYGAIRKSSVTIQDIRHATNYDQINQTTNVETPLDLGTDFYASITHIASWNHLTVEENDNVDICWENYTAKQYWKFYRQNDGSYEIKSAFNGKCLDVKDASWQDGANIQVHEDNDSYAQRWYVYNCGDGYQLRAKCTDCVMEMNAWNFYQGVNLVSGSKDNSSAEIFAINKRDFNDIGKTKLNVSCHNGNAKFEWQNSKCATNYNIKIWCGNSVLAGEAPINLWDVKNNSYDIKLGEGIFTAYIESYNPLGDYVQSDSITFSVGVTEQRADKIITYNGNIYSIYNIPVSWETAKEMCTLLGGHLVTINSQEEQNIINKLLDGNNLTYYSIGASNIDGDWRWITGENMNYFNWADGEPNNCNNNENYGTVFNSNSLRGKWNDISNTASSGTAYGFICELEGNIKPAVSERYNGNEYILFDKSVSWQNANEISKNYGGHLLYINDEKEQRFIESMLCKGNSQRYWLGGIKEDTFVWSNGNVLNYTNYSQGEPNNYDNLESYLEILNDGENKYKWNDNKNLPNDFSVGFIVEKENVYKPLLKGDVNLDNTVNIKDVVLMQRYLLGMISLNEQQLEYADYNDDGKFSLADIVAVQRYIMSA